MKSLKYFLGYTGFGKKAYLDLDEGTGCCNFVYDDSYSFNSSGQYDLFNDMMSQFSSSLTSDDLQFIIMNLVENKFNFNMWQDSSFISKKYGIITSQNEAVECLKDIFKEAKKRVKHQTILTKPTLSYNVLLRYTEEIFNSNKKELVSFSDYPRLIIFIDFFNLIFYEIPDILYQLISIGKYVGIYFILGVTDSKIYSGSTLSSLEKNVFYFDSNYNQHDQFKINDLALFNSKSKRLINHFSSIYPDNERNIINKDPYYVKDVFNFAQAIKIPKKSKITNNLQQKR